MRGEDIKWLRIFFNIFGSPPHAWGRLGSCSLNPSTHRFTPTCVGKTSTPFINAYLFSVHPHMRGEDVGSRHCCSMNIGSPPHAWGRHQQHLPTSTNLRFTPTCVGKTPLFCFQGMEQKVHPHMRGEDDVKSWCFMWHSGSPPHAWGRRSNWSRFTFLLRFTPTCVGKTLSKNHICPSIPVHPHMRGEDRSVCHAPPIPDRFTPTCVGKTSPSASRGI